MAEADSLDTTLTSQQRADFLLVEFQQLRELRQAARKQIRRLVELLNETDYLMRVKEGIEQ